MYTRDPLAAVPGGVLVGRMAPRMRRGEEANLSGFVAALGIPIVRTITGIGILEGGTVVRLRPDLFAYGQSIRCNEEGGRQLAEALRPLDTELVVVPLPGYGIHLDGYLGLADVDKAVVRTEQLPHFFIDRLQKLGYELLHCPAEEPWGVNLLAVAPGRVLISESAPHTAELLDERGVEVIPLAYSEIEKNGGGVHCSVQELWREPAAGFSTNRG
jgi:N-dimethylarginine dimethylaminohydrolase